jgi:outer membrane biosynthesis protein TonB
MDIITSQEHIKVEKAPSKANRTPKNKTPNRKSPKATPKGAVTMTPPTEPQPKSPKKPSNKAVTSPSPRKNPPRNPKKANSSHRKSSLSANSSGSSSSEDNVPQLSYASSGTESDDSDHFDTQLSYDMYALNINRCVYESQTYNISVSPALTKLL